MAGLMLRERNKAVLYVTSHGHLLVFREPDYPEVGVQPPGGTINEGETAKAGAVRELFEETGIRVSAEMLTELGRHTREYIAENILHRHHRHFFHCCVDEDVARRWTRRETNPDGADHEIVFALYWTPLCRRIELFADLDRFLPAVRDRLDIAA